MEKLKISVRKIRVEQRLHEAIKSRNISSVRTLLNQGLTPNGNPNDCKTKHPLDLAIVSNNIDIVSLLIEHGVNLDMPIRPLKNQSALHCAVMHGDQEIIHKIFENTTNWRVTDSNGASVLHLALESRRNNEIEILTFFLDLGMNVDTQNLKGETPLFVAGKYRLYKVVNYLLQRGANINAVNCNGESIIHYFFKNPYGSGEQICLKIGQHLGSDDEFIEWLLCKGVDSDCKNNAGQTPFELGIQNKLLSSLLILVKYIKDLSCFTNEKSRMILHSVLAFKAKSTSELKALITLLLDKQVPTDTVDVRGNTILHVAAEENNLYVMPKLLKHVSFVNSYNYDGETVLHVVIKAAKRDEEGLEDAVRALLANGASMTLENKDRLSPVHLAAQRNNLLILRIFEEHGADFKVCTANGENLYHLVVNNRFTSEMANDMIDFLTNSSLNINDTTLTGSTPLHLALKNLNENRIPISIIESLIKNGANVNSRERSTQLMPIHLAIKYQDEKALKVLIKAKADVNAKFFENSALHLAARSQKISLMRTTIMEDLIRSGADLDEVDGNNFLPLHYAIESGNSHLLLFLLELDIKITDCCAEHSDCLSKQMFLAPFALNSYSIKRRYLNMPVLNLLTYDNKHLEISEYLEINDFNKEIERMKGLQISHQTSLYDFVHFSLTKRTMYVNCENFVQNIESQDFETRFPEYNDLILHKYREASRRKLLLVPARLALVRLANFPLPDLCVEHVLSYLKNHSLKLLIRVSNVSFGE